MLFAALAASSLIAEPGWAKTFPIKFVSQSALASACKASHGNFYNTSGGGYGCATGCKNTPGTCAVECNGNTKTCTGTTPGRASGPENATGILSGTGVAAPVKPSMPGGVFGTGILSNGPGLSSAGPAAAGTPRAPAAPSAPPVILR
jgi:hypothetical protein